MTDLHSISESVINALKNTEEYKNYVSAFAEISKNPDLYARVNELREKNYQFHINNSEDLVDQVDALTNEYDDVINNESVSSFLSAEASFCRLIKEFNISVVEGLEFN